MYHVQYCFGVGTGSNRIRGEILEKEQLNPIQASSRRSLQNTTSQKLVNVEDFSL